MKLKASDEFFEQLGRMIDEDTQGFHRCRDCGVADGCFKERKSGKFRGQRSKSKAIVRLCLIDQKGSPTGINNIGYYCTKCRKGPRETKVIPKSIREKMPRLFA